MKYRFGGGMIGLWCVLEVAGYGCSDAPFGSDSEDDPCDTGSCAGGEAGASSTSGGTSSGTLGDGGQGADTGGSSTGGANGGTDATGGTNATGGTESGGGTGAAAGASGNGGTGGSDGGTAGQGGSQVGCTSPNMIDDFEDGNSQPCMLPGFGWFTQTGDTTGVIVPPAGEALPVAIAGGPRDQSLLAMHFVGTGITSGYAGLSLGFDEHDASSRSGVRFWTRSGSGNFRVRVEFATAASRETGFGGACVPSGGKLCWDHWGANRDVTTSWQLQDINFSQLGQHGWGVAVGKDLAHLQEIRIAFEAGGTPANPSSFDLWIDDIEFY